MHHLAIARHLILVTKILSQKGFVSTAGYDDEFDGEESDRDAGAQQNSNRDRDAKQLKIWLQMAKDFGKRDVNTLQITRSHVNGSDSTKKSFDNMHELMQHTSNNTTKCKH